MFSGIASRYDTLNHVLSFGLDIGWRKKVARETGKIDCQRILDVCTGSGDMAVELAKYWRGRARVEGLDFSRELIGIGQRKTEKLHMHDRITFREGNAESLPYDSEIFDAVTITFGLRNIRDRLKALQEFYRVTKPGGCFICLEFSQPVNPVLHGLYSLYLMKFVPFISRIFGSDPAAYQYLGNTIKDFPPPGKLVELIESTGWENVSYENLAGGIVCMHRANK
jgi:demethylmenaquinone methyltransferase/2-methoxy-6-polyprenyl-1,4-benzoquinol methylase